MRFITLKKREEVDEQFERVLNTQAKSIRFGNEMIERQLLLIDFTERDLAVLAYAKRYIEANVHDIVDQFYSALQKESEMIEIIEAHSSIERLKKTLTIHVIEMFNGKIDEAFIEKRRRIALTHLRIGLEPKWYIASFQHLFESLFAVISRYFNEPAHLFAVMKSISKMLNFEQQLVLEQYEKENEKLRLQIERIKNEMKQQLKEAIYNLGNVSEEVSASVSSLNMQANEILSFAHEASSIAETSAHKSEKGKDQLQSQLMEMCDIDTKMKQIQTDMTNLKQSANKIENITNLVTAIADQTNMLSLNASIEAARAGEHGKGFAVVADEVRKLAFQTKQSVSDVVDILTEINEKINHISESLQVVSHLVANGANNMRDINAFFDELAASLQRIREKNLRIDQEMKTCVNVVSEIHEAISHVSASTEELEAMAGEL
ncbi:globin-coupled sensor protein [Thermolongibacillus altinsuensis]|uniref:globin-coupled sensor protein n=1 Tax=Thermolongibacillus altinsuensis TaxID=575256 RepID=UPI00242A301B|nr:globin-coupled sensor protein [Thermolongibacillus altinsuensis]GMB08668.1 heme-based aerotactic transducer HemAT [Thermolongibacillus altinsuensis]